MTELIATINRKNQITLPAIVCKQLGVRASDKIAFVISEDGVRIVPVRLTLDDLYGSVPALPGETADLEQEIDESLAAEADHLTGLTRWKPGST